MGTNEPTGQPGGLVCASVALVNVTAAGVDVSLPLAPEMVGALMGYGDPRSDGALYLRLEGIVGQEPANLSVHLDLAPSKSSGAATGLHAGVIGLFGVGQASKPDRHGEGGSGLACSLDVSRILRQLWREAASTPTSLRVRLAFTRAMRPGAQVRIGRVTLLHRSTT